MPGTQIISWRHGVVIACLAISSLAAWDVLGAAQTPAQSKDGESIEQQKLQEFGLPKDLRRTLNSQLMAQITEIDRACQLTLEQRKKLRLIGQGDIKHFFEMLRASQHNPGNAAGPEFTLSMMIEGGLFHDSSIFFKSIPNVLNADQLVPHKLGVQKARQIRKQAATKLLLEAFEGDAPLTASERKTLAALMDEIGPAGNNGQGAAIYLALQIGAMLEKHRDRFPSDKCREQVSKVVREIKTFEPALRLAGYFPPEDDGAFSLQATAGRNSKK